MTKHITLKTGGDPRTLPDYAALRDELSKLTHPARPDVNWQYVQRLCLSMFEQNGVELQTAAWYTLARTHQSGLAGLNEGLAILEALISRQWETLWPKTQHARMEILSGLSQRLQQRMRMLPFNSSHLSELYRAEALLTSLSAVLQRLELKHLSQLDTLRTLIRSNAERLESSNETSDLNVNMKPDSESPLEKAEPIEEVKWVYVVHQENQPNGEDRTTAPVSVRQWKPFLPGCVPRWWFVSLWRGDGFLCPDPTPGDSGFCLSGSVT